MTTALRLAGVFAVVASVSLPARSLPVQQPAQEPSVPATGLILGRVIDFSGGTGVGSAIVSLSQAGLPAPIGPAASTASLRFPSRVVTDGEGHFLFHDLPKGSYVLTATKAGYGDTSYGRRSPADTTNVALVLGDGERKSDANLMMWKFASMTGTVTDEAGEPVIGLPISVFRRTFIGGRPRFTQVSGQNLTDDRGLYRVRSVAPGDYVVAIVTSETTMSVAWQSAEFTAMRTDSQAANRELQRSSILASVFGFGQRVGTLSMSSGGGGGLNAAGPPVVGDKVFVYPTTFYPSAGAPSKATIVTVSSGEERSSIDFQVRATPTARISGVMAGPDGPEGGIGMELINAVTDEADRDPVFDVAESVSDASGAFTFLGVPLGNYEIRVQKNPAPPEQRPGAGMTTVIQTGNGGMITTSSGGGPSPPVTDDPTLWARVPVSVTGSDVTGLNVTLRTGIRLSGRVQFVGSKPQPTPAQLAEMSINVQAAGGRTQAALTINGGTFYSTRGSVDANGQFRTYQFPPGRFVIRATSPAPGWVFAGAMFRGRDVADAPIEVAGEDLTDIVITFTDKPSELSGSVHGAQGVDAVATVLVFPADPANWTDYGPAARRLKLVRPSSDGSYKTALPAGDYLVTAIHSPVPSTWTDPEFLKQLAATATRVTMADGANKVQDLRSAEVR
jgi:hypothetical protein